MAELDLENLTRPTASGFGPEQRARVLVAALKQSRPEAGREALHARVESLLTALDLIRDELLHLRKTIRRGK